MTREHQRGNLFLISQSQVFLHGLDLDAAAFKIPSQANTRRLLVTRSRVKRHSVEQRSDPDHLAVLGSDSCLKILHQSSANTLPLELLGNKKVTQTVQPASQPTGDLAFSLSDENQFGQDHRMTLFQSFRYPLVSKCKKAKVGR